MEPAVKDYSPMEIEISDKNGNMCDGAKDKGETAIGIPKPDRRKENFCDSECGSECDSHSDIDEIQLPLECSDGVVIEGMPFKSESRLVVTRLWYGFGVNKVESSSKTLEMVKVFCEAREKIRYDYRDAAEKLDKLNKYNSKFLQDFKSYAIRLVTAGFDLDVISLIDLMMEEAVNMFTTNMTETEVENFFFLNSSKENPRHNFLVMKEDLLTYRDFFDTNFIDNNDIVSKGVIDVRANDLLKRKFHSLESYEQRRQWLTAHFLLRRPRFDRVYFKEKHLLMMRTENVEF